MKKYNCYGEVNFLESENGDWVKYEDAIKEINARELLIKELTNTIDKLFKLANPDNLETEAIK